MLFLAMQYRLCALCLDLCQPVKKITLAARPVLLLGHAPRAPLRPRPRLEPAAVHLVKDAERPEAVRDALGADPRAREVERVGTELCRIEPRGSESAPRHETGQKPDSTERRTSSIE